MENQELKKAGLKVTLPRVRIMQILTERSERHLSAEDVYKALLETGEDVGLATVYRVLTQFETAGLVKRHYFETGHSVFELYDGEHHDHILCTQCSKVTEFVDDLIEQRQHQAAEELGYELTGHSHILYGVCADCRAAKAVK